MSGAPDIVVAGAGPWGLGAAWLAARDGARVAVLDDGRAPAGRVAAGMLGARSEAAEDERDMFELARRALEAWETFAPDLAAASGRDPGLRPTGAIVVAARPEHIGAVRRRAAVLAAWDAPAPWRTGSELRALEPGLGPAVAGGLALDEEHQVEPRAMLAALRQAATAAGVRVVPAAAAAILRDGSGRAAGLVDADGVEHRAGATVLAAGHGAARLAGAPWIRPVKGQILRLVAAPGAPVPVARTIRAPGVYLAPRDGEVVVGATSEERSDRHATAGAVHDLLEEALRVVPELREMALAEVAVGLRPAAPDGRPLVGRDGDGVIWAAGGYRHGIALLPLAAAAVAELASGRPAPAWAEALSPARLLARGATR